MADANPPEDKDPQAPEAQPQVQKPDGGINRVKAAAVVGGAAAAAAGAYLGTRALARRNREKDGRPLNSVMATAITATDLSQNKE
jgi:hypothetical protein